MSDQAMIKRLNQRINGLRKQIAEMARNQGAQSGQNIETIRQDISRCESSLFDQRKPRESKSVVDKPGTPLLIHMIVGKTLVRRNKIHYAHLSHHHPLFLQYNVVAIPNIIMKHLKF